MLPPIQGQEDIYLEEVQEVAIVVLVIEAGLSMLEKVYHRWRALKRPHHLQWPLLPVH